MNSDYVFFHVGSWGEKVGGREREREISRGSPFFFRRGGEGNSSLPMARVWLAWRFAKRRWTKTRVNGRNG